MGQSGRSKRIDIYLMLVRRLIRCAISIKNNYRTQKVNKRICLLQTATELEKPSNSYYVMPLRLRKIAEIFRDDSDKNSQVELTIFYAQEIVEIPPLIVGVETLHQRVIRENESHICWTQASYLSLPTSVYNIKNALIHGSAGIIGVDGNIITETTWHTEPSRHRYKRRDPEIELDVEELQVLSGTHLNLLTPGGNNYWHAVIDGVAKISAIPAADIKNIQTILFSSDAIGQAEFLGLLGLPDSIAIRPVLPSETLRVERLVLPWDLHGVFDYHPVLNCFFDEVLTNHVMDKGGRIKRLYVDRRGSSQRRLLNEDQVVASLEELGFVAVRLENLTVNQQINLFRQAIVIVSPHGAGLTNIGFARPGCIVIELMMDAYVNWCYRRIAALRKLSYGCITGTAHQPWGDLNPSFHNQLWEISVEEVSRAVRRMLT